MPQRILVDDAALKDCYHAASATNRESGEEINQAYAVLKEPARRIAHLLALHGRNRPASEQPAAVLFNLFFDVSNVLKNADGLIISLTSASSALQRAALTDTVLTMLDQLEKTALTVQTLQAQHIQVLGEMDSVFPELDDAQWKRLAEVGNDLVFLEKWKSEVGKRVTRLQEMLMGAMN